MREVEEEIKKCALWNTKIPSALLPIIAAEAGRGSGCRRSYRTAALAACRRPSSISLLEATPGSRVSCPSAALNVDSHTNLID